MRAVACGSVCERVARVKSSKRSRSTTVRPTRPRRRAAAASTRSTSATSVGVELRAAIAGAPERALRADRAAAAGRVCTGRGSRLCASAWRCRPAAAPEHRDERRLAAARRPRRPSRCPRVAQLRRGHRADAPQPLDRERVQERQLAVGRHDEQPVGLGDAARDLGQELRPRDADRDRQADPLAHVAPQPRGDVDRRAGDPLHPARRRGTPRRSRAPRRAASCPRTPRRRPCSPRCRPTSAAARRSRPGTAAAPGAPPIAVRTPHALAS